MRLTPLRVEWDTMRKFVLGLVVLAFSSTGVLSSQKQVLVEIDDKVVTAHDLNGAVASSPFAVQMNTMDRDKQASLRGLLLKRLVGSRLLELEAEALNLDKTPAFKHDLDTYTNGLLFQKFLSMLKNTVKLTPKALKELRLQFKSEPDAYAAAKSAETSALYRALRLKTNRYLQGRYHVTLHADRIKPGITADTVLITGDGITVRYGDIVKVEDYPVTPRIEWLKNRLYEHAELVMMAKAAREEKMDVSSDVQVYKRERMPALMVSYLEKKWLSKKNVLRDYLKSHPAIAQIPTRWHIGQIVVDNEAQAQKLRREILNGKSLFELAGKFSIDPYGRSRNGDMGWIQEGKGHPLIEKSLKKLPNDKVSDVIRTAKGYHLITILERKPGETRTFAAIRDKIKQIYFSEKMTEFLKQAQKQHKVVWKVIAQNKPAK